MDKQLLLCLQERKSMRIPKKINPDRIQDSFVQVFFSTVVPFEPLVGYVYHALAPLGFSYLNRPQQPEAGLFPSEGFSLQIGPQHFFYREEVSIRMDEPGALLFNCMGPYIGWEQYSTIIRDVLTALFEANIISSFLRVGIRYVSLFENMDVQDALTLSFSMGVQQQDYRLAHFRTVWEDKEGYLISVTLGTERAPGVIENEDGTILAKKSVIDIDVIRQGFELKNLEEMFSLIDETHLHEKTVFFGLMKEDFLNSLNPEYA